MRKSRGALQVQVRRQGHAGPYQCGRRGGRLPGRIRGGSGLVAGLQLGDSSRSNSSCRLLVYGVNETGLNLPPARSERGPSVPCSGGVFGCLVCPPERAAMGGHLERGRGCDRRTTHNPATADSFTAWPMPPQEGISATPRALSSSLLLLLAAHGLPLSRSQT